jgi:integrase
MTAQPVPLRILGPDETNIAKPARSRKKGGRINSDVPGLHRPAMRCKECAGCAAKPMKKCLDLGTQDVWRYHKSVGGELYRASTGCTDLRVAKQVARDLLERWEREHKGLPTEERVFLDDALMDFRKHLTTGRGGTHQQAKIMRFLHEVFDAARRVAPLAYVDELGEEVYADWLPSARARNLSNATINGRIEALKRFGVWLRATRRLDHDPFEILVKLPVKKDRRQVKRALWPDESEALRRSALRRKIDEEKAKNAAAKTLITPSVVRRRAKRLHVLRREGHVRALIYFLVLRTGLRRDEARSIRICDVQFDRKQIRIAPEACKVGEEQFVQMDDDLARHLRSYIRRLGDVDDTQPLLGFIKMVKKKGAKKAEPVWYSWVPSMPAFDMDLAHAGIEKKDKSDRVVVFHSLRKSYITYLWMDDENRPQDVQRLARHSDLKLTQQVYTDWEMLAGREWAAAERLAGWMRG